MKKSTLIGIVLIPLITVAACSSKETVSEPEQMQQSETTAANDNTEEQTDQEEFRFVNSPLDAEYNTISVEYQEKHRAVDLPAVMDAPIYAVADGAVVKTVTEDDAYSKYVMIDHHNGLFTLYAVCNSIIVNEGDDVAAGQEIAKVGITGNVLGPLLHFELRDSDGNKLDPTEYLNEVLK